MIEVVYVLPHEQDRNLERSCSNQLFLPTNDISHPAYYGMDHQHNNKHRQICLECKMNIQQTTDVELYLFLFSMWPSLVEPWSSYWNQGDEEEEDGQGCVWTKVQSLNLFRAGSGITLWGRAGQILPTSTVGYINPLNDLLVLRIYSQVDILDISSP